ncbi:MAG: DUF1592 domain-containing protein [Myxococcota bacterium]
MTRTADRSWGLMVVPLLGALATQGCYQGASGSEDMPGEGGDDLPGESDGDDPDGPSGPPPAASESSPGLRLLTQREFHNAVRDLLGVSLDRELIPREALVDGHGHIAQAQGVGLDEVDRYYELGLAAAEQAVLQMQPGCDLNTPACAASVAEQLLPRIFREPGPVERTERYLSILEEPDAGESVSERLATLIATATASPHFLYRRELGDERVEGYVRWLTDYEIASRLSFLVWQSGPDEALLDAAAAGQLRDPEVRAQHLTRMLADDRARAGQVGFALDWLGTAMGGTIDDKDPEVLEGTSAELARRAEHSLERTIEDVLFDGAKTFMGLLDTDRYWVDESLAALLDLPPAGESLEARELDPLVRRGLLMHPAVLAAHTKESGASPFSVGEFIYENVLCEKIAPPLEIPEFDPGQLEGETLREQLEELTADAACQACHARIGPPGFAFLSFDPIGRHLAADGEGRPFDTSGTVPVGEGTVSFDSAAELSSALATHDNTARCVAKRLFRWTYGYFEGGDDESYVQQLQAQAISSGAELEVLLSTIVRSDPFAQVRLGG